MSRIYTAVSGNTLEVNIAGGTFLDRLTFPLFEKIGCFPKTRDECLIVARLIHNYIHLQQYWSSSWKEIFGLPFEKESAETIEWLEEVEEFFRDADGLILDD